MARGAAHQEPLTRRTVAVMAGLILVVGVGATVLRLGDGSSDVATAGVPADRGERTTAAPTSSPAPERDDATATPSPTTAAPVSPSFDERRRLHDRMVDDREAVRQGDLDASRLQTAGADSGRYDLAISKTAPYTITVGLRTVTNEATAWFTERYGEHLAFAQNEHTIGAPPSAEGGPLWGHRFDLVRATDDGQPRATIASAFVVFGSADGLATVSWSGGCNQIGGDVTVTADRIDVGYQVVGTAMGCADGSEEQDAWVTEIMTSDPQWTLEDDRLTLRNDRSVLELKRSA